MAPIEFPSGEAEKSGLRLMPVSNCSVFSSQPRLGASGSLSKSTSADGDGDELSQ
jgi:hypothetical protein